MTESSAPAAGGSPSGEQGLDCVLGHLERFALATARRARRWLTPLRVYAGLVLLAAVWSALRLSSWNGSTNALAFLAWILPLSLPSVLLYLFFMVFRTIAELPAQMAGLRAGFAELSGPSRLQLDRLMDRSEGGRFGLGRVITMGRLLLELRHMGGLAGNLPQGMGMAPLMANPLFWLLFLFTSLVGMGVIGLAVLVALLA